MEKESCTFDKMKFSPKYETEGITRIKELALQVAYGCKKSEAEASGIALSLEDVMATAENIVKQYFNTQI
jgi:hypothetical protein